MAIDNPLDIIEENEDMQLTDIVFTESNSILFSEMGGQEISYEELSTKEVIDLMSSFVKDNIMKHFTDHCKADQAYLQKVRPLFLEFNEPNFQREEIAQFVASQDV